MSAGRCGRSALLVARMPQVICHGIPDDRELQSGDIVNVDVTAFLNGYHGDLNEVTRAATWAGATVACLFLFAVCTIAVASDAARCSHPRARACAQTFVVGEVDEEGKKLIKCAHDCLMKALAACKPGVRYRDVGDIITKHASSQG